MGVVGGGDYVRGVGGGGGAPASLYTNVTESGLLAFVYPQLGMWVEETELVHLLGNMILACTLITYKAFRVLTRQIYQQS